MIASLLPALVLAAAPAGAATPTELFLSEYVEGSSNNKAIEIYNGTGSAVDLDAGDYEIFLSFNGGTFTTTIDLAGIIADGDVFVVADDGAGSAVLDAADLTPTNSFFNGDDAVALQKSGADIDVIGQIGFDPGSQWGSGLTSTQDNTLRRMASVCAGDPDGSNAFDPSVQWDGYAQDTFDGLGSHTANCNGAPSVVPGDLVINEVDYDQAGTDDAEYVEIKNVTGAAIDLADVSLVFASGTGASIYDTIALSGTLAAGDYYVVCGDAANVANCDLDDGPNTNFIQNGAPDAMAIFFGETVIDALSYEGDAAAPYVEGSGLGLADNADDALTGISRCADGADTDQNNIDFLAARPLTPGATNDCPVIPDGLSPGDLVINEIIQNPAAVSDSNGEWFEVYNATENPIDLEGLTIKDDGSNTHTIGSSVVVAAGGFAVLGRDSNSATNGGVSVDYQYSNFFLGNSDDEVVIVDGTTEIDRVNYDGGPAFPDPNGASMSLIDTGLDNNVGANWCTAFTPYGDGDLGTPGAENRCPSEFELVINEIIQNPSAVFDSNGEWFELYNPTGDAIDIDGWTIRDDGSNSHMISSGGPLFVPAGGYVVLGINGDFGTNGAVVVDYEYSGFFLGNSGDEVIVEDALGFEVDRVEYDGGPAFPDPTGKSMSLKLPEANNNVGTSWCEASTPFGDGDLGTPGLANDCPPTLIHEVQGSGPAVAISGPVVVEGIVTSLFTRDDVLDGFFLQEEDADADGDAATSEGIFVFCRGNCPAVPPAGAFAPGDLATVTGSATDFFGMSQIDMASGSVVVGSSGNALPTATPVDLPASASTVAEATFENVEGMLVSFPDTLVVSEYFQLARFGQVVLTESSRPFQFTHDNEPSVAGYTAFLDELAARRIILDDDNNDNNDAIFDGPDEAYYYPEGGLSVANKFRGGDTITDLTGVMHWSFAGFSGTDAWRVRPIPEVYDYTFTPVNPRPAAPADVGGTLKVASANVLNYFTTIDLTSSGSSGDCGPSGTLDCRGADSAAELARQRAKTVAALVAIDADIVGLVEIENKEDASLIDLVDGLNAEVGPGTYEYIDTGYIGDDAIKVGLIYKPATVAPVGSFAILDSSVDPGFIDTKNRPVLIQTFDEVATGARVTVAVNHFKSKGSPCDDVGDPGLGDGQANCNLTRTKAATALVNHLATDPTGSGDPDFLIIGDLNAYAMEDPIAAITGAGYTDLIDLFGGSGAYSFVFDGQLGYLDHALANDSLLSQVTGVTEWHINADEVNVFDYNDDVRDSPGEASFERESAAALIYEANAYRSSDHDPLVVGLQLDTARDLKVTSKQALEALDPVDNLTAKRINNAIARIDRSLTRAWWDGESEIKTHKVFDQERRAIVQLELVVASGADEVDEALWVIGVLLEADRRLAQDAIDAAIAGGGDPAYIAAAQDYMAMAAADIAAGLYNEAVNNYKEAWFAAIEALS